jgi:hypothetical protein
MADQYTRVDDVSKGASEGESGDSSSDGGKLVGGAARDPIHNNAFLSDMTMSAVSLVAGSSKEDNSEIAVPIKINYILIKLPAPTGSKQIPGRCLGPTCPHNRR